MLRAMRTFWIADPMPRSPVPRRLEWGSSEWAADSCLAAWSEFEREWTGAPAPMRPARTPPRSRPEPLPSFVVACFILLTLGVGVLAWSVFRTLFG